MACGMYSFFTGAVVFGVALCSAGAASADEVPPEFQGVWSIDCANENAPSLNFERSTVTLTLDGANHAYEEIEVSHTFYGGVNATGEQAWFLISRTPGAPYSFIAQPPPYGQKGAMIAEVGGIKDAPIGAIVGPQLHHCASVKAHAPVQTAQVLDVPFAETGDDGGAPRCSSRTQVIGLDPNGDGFLSVRSGPGTDYAQIDKLRNGDIVYSCDFRGNWIAIVYGPSKAKKGWVHGRWLAG